MLKFVPVRLLGPVLGVMALGVAAAGAAVTSTAGPCPSPASARATPACAITTPAHPSGAIASDQQRDYYVLSARKGTKLHLGITDGDRCLVGHFVSCGTNLHATLLSAAGRRIAATPVAEPQTAGPAQYATVSPTLPRTGTYYVVVTGTVGTVTPPPPSPASPSATPYTLRVTAAPRAQWPLPVRVTVRGGFHRVSVTQDRGGLISIALEDNNPSTGYGWAYAARPNRSVLGRVSDRTAPGRAGVAGAPQPRTIVYRALAAGMTSLRLVYLPPSGAGTKPAASLTLTVTVP